MLDLKGNRVRYFCHSTFSLTTPSGEVDLIDPFVMSNPVCPKALHHLPRLDVICVSHAHGDHFADLLALAQQHKSKIVAIYETCVWLNKQGFEDQTSPMGKGGSQKGGGFEITLTHAFHSNSIDDHGTLVYGGEPAGLVIRMPGGFTLYHAGDTALFSDMKLVGEFHKPHVAMLPIGDRFTMGPREAAHAIRFLGVQHV